MTVRVAVVTITCRRCGQVVAQSIPRVAEPDEVEQGPTPCSPTFAQTDGCPDHPPSPPDANHVPGVGFTTWTELPLAWTTRLLALPGSVVGEVGVSDG